MELALKTALLFFKCVKMLMSGKGQSPSKKPSLRRKQEKLQVCCMSSDQGGLGRSAGVKVRVRSRHDHH